MRPIARRRGLPWMGGAVLTLLAAALSAPAPAGADEFDSLVTTFREEFKSDKPETRLHALTLVAGAKDPRGVDLLVSAVADSLARRAAVAKAQTEAQTNLEQVLAKIEKANLAPSLTPRDIELYNRRMRKYQTQRDEILAGQRQLAFDGMQAAAEVDAAVAAISTLLKTLKPADGDAAVERLAGLWFAKAGPDERERFVMVLAGAPTVPASRERLRVVSMDIAQHPFLRAMALHGRGQFGDGEPIPDLVGNLSVGLDQWPVIEASIDALRRIHKREAIAPLIEFLGRQGTGRMRRTAWKALRSLTGLALGPVQEVWVEWWKDVHKTFVMPATGKEPPEAPSEYGSGGSGPSFFGDPLASQHVFFVLDISKSMLELAHPGAAGNRGKDRRIDILRREFAGAIDQLDETGLFNVVLFGSGIVTFSSEAVAAEAVAKARAKKFLNEAEPIGGTNIHDALEAAFRLATPKGAGDKFPYDTIVFLTDGTPTSGKLQLPEQILEAVSRMNVAGVLSLRVYGIGECDEEFLKKLGEQNKGTFTKR